MENIKLTRKEADRVRVALGLLGIKVDLKVAAAVIITVRKSDELGSSFSVDDVSEIEMIIDGKTFISELFNEKKSEG